MKQFRVRVIVSLVIMAFLGAALLGIAHAATTSAELATAETTNGPYIRAADTVSIRGTVNGDVIVAAGGLVEIDGTVHGSVYAVSERVVIRGVVTGNVHAAGSEVEFAARDTGSAFLAASDVRVGDGARLQNLFVAGSELVVHGEIARNLYGAGSEVLVGSKVGGDVTIAGEQIVINGAATVGGNFSYSSSAEATIENDRSIQGSIKRTDPEEKISTQERITTQLVDMFYWLAANILIAATLLLLMPKVFIPAEISFLQKPLNNYFKALVFVIFTPILLILMLFTVIGIPLALVGLLFYTLVLILAPTASAHFIGKFALERLKLDKQKPATRNYWSELAAVAAGFFLLAIVGLVPVLGGLVTVAAFFLGVAILVSRNLLPFGCGETR